MSFMVQELKAECCTLVKSSLPFRHFKEFDHLPLTCYKSWFCTGYRVRWVTLRSRFPGGSISDAAKLQHSFYCLAVEACSELRHSAPNQERKVRFCAGDT